ncbi:MAG: rane protein [Polyangiaceae bacterium]|nr:rane protein [Polyangiaceae bacterium]
MAKFRRWYQGGAELDLEIHTRFGPLIESALAGGLDDWTKTLSGQRALVVVLDQFVRNVHRGTPRAYAGDRRALSLSLAMLERGAMASLDSEAQLFVMMPLLHAEDVVMQARAVELADGLVRREAREELRPAWAVGAERARHYQSVIARFGRFPHRNAILGRATSGEEQAFLDAEAKAGGPLDGK